MPVELAPSPVPLGRRQSRLRKNLGLTIAPGAVVLSLLILWEGLGRAGGLPITIPHPSQIAAAFGEQWDDLAYHAAPTLGVAVAGYFLAMGLALLGGAVTLMWRRAERPIFNLGLIIDSMPIIALAPILIIWLHNGAPARIALATIAALFPQLVGAIQGFKATDRHAAELFHVLAASPRQRLFKLALPCALPYLFAAFKIAAPLAVLGTLFGEWAGGDRGLGMMMVYAMYSFDPPVVWMTILAVCGFAIGGFGLVALIESLLIDWDADAGGPSLR